MNKTYHVVWNEITGTWVAVPEHAARRGKRSAKGLALSALALAATATLAGPGAQELPTGGQVVAGQAGISQNGSTLTVNQTTQRAAIDWRTFNVGSQATVNFVQPDASSVALNRVNDPNPSQIFGRINANGQVFLSNPSGIYFAPGASVNVGGLVATTHRISLDDFMAGKATFERNGATGSVINQGELKAALSGYIALLAPEVRNEGVIVAHMGTVALAAGEAFELQFDAGNTLAGLRVTPSSIKALVDNRSAVLAPGGLIILSAQAMDRVQGGVVQNSGRIEATGLQQRGGRIVLSASTRIENTGVIAANAGSDGPAGTVTLTAPEVVNSGVIEAKGNTAITTGGSVQVAAGQFTQADTGVLDVSAPVQAGSVKVQASGSVTLAGRVDATATTEAAPSRGGDVTVQAAQVSLARATIDTSGDTGGHVTLDASAPAPDTPPAPLPAPERGQLMLNAGTTLASRGRRGSGGTLTLLGDTIALNDTTALDASGATGGGRVRVGGGWQGGDGLYQATRVTMAQGASIDVSATQAGHGGLAVLWSDALRDGTVTTVAGRITAAGAGVGAHGGQVETSGHMLAVTDTASVRTGPGGLWLLDPADITISSSADANQSNSGGVFTPGSGAGNAIVNVTTLVNALNSGDVTITTQNSGTAGSGFGDITVNANIAKTGSTDSTLTLRAARDIWFTGYGATSANSKLNLVLVADWDSSGGGGIYFNGTVGGGAITVNTHGGHVWMGGNSYGSAFGTATWNGLTVGTGSTDAGNSTATWEGANLLSTTINTAGGDLLINARTDRFMNNEPRYGVIVKNSSISTGAGNITVTGRLGQTSGSQSTNPALYGVRLETSTLSTTTGAISITGGEVATDNSANTGGVGVNLYNSTVATTGATGGGITITGTTGVNSGSNRRDGVRLESYGDNANTTVSTVAGNIAITGTSNVTSNATSAGVALQTGKAANTDTNNPTVKVVSQTGNVSLTGDNPSNTDTGSSGVWLSGANYGKVYVGYDGSNAYSGNTTISGRSFVQNNFAGGYLLLGGSGALTIQSIGNSFVQGSASYETLVLDGTYAFSSAHSALTIGKDIGTTIHSDTVNVSSAITTAGSVSLYGGDINLNANITSTGSGAAVLVKGSASIVQPANLKVVTNGGAITLWSDSDASGDGYIRLNNNSVLDSRTAADRTANLTSTASGGGAITLGGGADITTGYAVSNAAPNYGGINFGDQTVDHNNINTIYSGGGNVVMRGKASNAMMGINWVNGGTLNAGSTGTVSLTGLSTNNGHGMELGSWNNGATTTLVAGGGNAGSPAITLTGTAGPSGGNGIQTSTASLQAFGTGGIAITGNATNGTYGLTSTSFDALSASGAITINGGTKGLNYGGTLGAKASTAVTSSSAAVTLTGDVMNWSAAATVATSGAVTLQSNAASFTSAFTTANLSLNSAVTGLTIGKSTNTANVTLASATNIAGAISVYGGTLTQSAALTSTQANAGVLLKATAGIANSANITTNGGDITLWANSAGATAGGIQVANNVTLSSSGGAITLGGSAGGAVISGAPATSANNTTLPQGYAQNYGASTAGVLLGTDNGTTGQNSAVTINSGNGRIGMAGQSSQYVGTVSIGLISYQGINVNAGTGNIVLNGLSTGAVGGNTDIGFALAAYFNTGSGASKWQTNGGNIVMNGSSSGATGVGIGADPQGGTNGTTVTIENTSASSGGVTINGSSTNASSLNIGIRSWNTNILSKSGAITLNATGAAGSSWNIASGYTTTVGYLGGSDVTTSPGNVTITADTLNTLGAININSTGALTIQSNSASFSAAQALTNVSIASGLTGFTLGKSTNTADITVANPYTVAGLIAIYGGNVTLNGSLTNTVAGSGLLVKASGNVVLADGRSLQTNGGDITLWADSDASGAGYIQLVNNNLLDSRTAAARTANVEASNLITAMGGGKITLGGGNGATAADGYAVSAGTTGLGGVNLGDQNNQNNVTTLYSGGGDVVIRGKQTGTSAMGLQWMNGGLLNAGQGTVRLDGLNTGGGHGMELGAFRQSGDVRILASGGDATTAAINIQGTGADTGRGVLAQAVRLYSTGAGGISITGTAGANGPRGVDGRTTLDVLAVSGPITINGGVKGIEHVGSIGALSSSPVPASSSNVTLTGDTLVFGANAAAVRTTGTLTVQPFSTSFSSALAWPLANLNALAPTVGGLTLGKPGNTADITVASATSIAGPISIYGGNVAVNASLTSTASGAAILLKGSGNVTVDASTSLTTNGGAITLWADSDASGAGGILVRNSATLDSRTSSDRTGSTHTTGGGAITLGGGLDDGGSASGASTYTGGLVANDGRPDGYAVNYGNASLQYGILLGTEAIGSGQNSGIRFYSGSGDIRLQGKVTTQNGANGASGILAYQGLGMNAGTNGSLTLLGVSALTSGQYSGGMDLQAWRNTSGATSTLQTVNGNINVVGVASGGTGNNIGINAQANDATRAMTFAATGTGSVTLDGRGSGTSPFDIYISTISLLSGSGAVNLAARNSSVVFSSFPSANTVYLGAQAGSLVTSSSAPITLSADAITFSAAVQATTTGTVTVQPYGTSFTSALSWPISGLTLGAGVSGLTLGKASNTADITIASATSVAGPIAVYGGNLAINAGLTATGSNTITLKGTGTVTDGASGYVSASNLLLLGGNVTLDSTSNAIGTLAASGVGSLTYLDTDALTLGSVAGTNGISASGVVSLASRTGDLTVAQNVATTNTSSTALTLNAGLTATAGTASGGNLILSGSPTITVGSGGTARLFSGSVAGSTGLTALVGSGTGRFRYNSDETGTNYTLALATGLNAIYREQPTVTRSIDDQSVTYGNAATYTFTVGSAQNGDSFAQAFAVAPTVSVGGGVSTSNWATAGTHSLTGTGGSASSQLGYAVSGGIGAGTLTVTQRNLTVTYVGVDKVYDGSTSASATLGSDNRVTGDQLGLSWTSATFADANAGPAKTITLTGVSLSGTDAANYALVGGNTASTTAAVTPRTVTLAGSKTYDGNTTLGAGTVTLGNLVGSETLDYSGGTASNAHVATAGKYINTLTLLDGGNGGLASNYQLPTLNASNAAVTITAAPLTASASIGGTLARAYDGTTGASGASISGSVSGAVAGDTLALDTTGLTLAYNSAHVVGASSIAASGSAGFSVSGSSVGSLASDYSLAAPTIAAVSASITPATLVATLANSGVTKVYDATTAVPGGFTPSWTFSGLATGDTAASLNTTGAAYNSANVVGATHVTVSGLALTGVTGSRGSVTSDYQLDATTKDVAASITAKAVTISGLAAAGKTYDGTDSATVTQWGSASGTVGGETLQLTGSSASFSDANAGPGKTVTAIGYVLGNGTGLASNYQLASTSATTTASIAKAALTVIANNDAKFVTQADGSGFNGVSYSGFVNGETAAVLGGSVAVNRSNASTNSAGIYSGVLVADTNALTSTNYSFSTQSGSYTIVPSNQLLVRVANTSTTYGAAGSYSLTAEYYDGSQVVALNGITNNGSNNYTVSDGAGGSLTFTLGHAGAAFSTAGFLKVGSYQVNGTGISTTNAQNFSNVLTLVGSEAITPKTVTASASGGISKVYDGTTAMTGVTLSLAGVVPQDTVTVAGAGAFTSKDAGNGNVGFTVSNLVLSGADGGNYVLTGGNSFSGSNGTIEQKTVQLSATKVYDGTTGLTGAVTIATGVGTETLTYTGAAANAAHVADNGSNFINALTLADGTNGGLAANYRLPTLNAGNAAVTITPKALTASAGIGGTLTKVYDGDASASGAQVTGTVNGAVSGDVLSLVTSGLTLAYDSAHVVGASAIQASGNAGFSIGSSTHGSVAGDYSFTQPTIANAAASITARTVTLVGSKTYDGSTALTGSQVTVGNLVSGESLGVSGATANSSHVADNGVNYLTALQLIDGSGGNIGLASDYQLPTLNVANAAVTVNAKTLSTTAQIGGTTSKAYDGSNAATGATVTGSIGGAVSGDTLTLDASGLTLAYDSAHAGAATQIAATGSLAFTISGSNGSQASDYTLATPALSTAASITPRALGTNASLGGAATKVYDGTTGAIGAIVTGSVTGGITGDSFTLSTGGLTLAYDSAHVATATQIAASGSLSFALTTTNGSLASDYSLATPVLTRSASITPLALTTNAALAGTATKVYDGTTAASGLGVTGTASGGLAGDSFTLDSSALTFAYNTAHVATANAITASGTLGFTVSGPNGSQASDYSLATPALSLAATITPRALTGTAAVTGPATKVYDGSTAANGNGVSGSVTGGLNGDTLALDTSALTFAYDTAHVATATQIVANGVLGFTLVGSSQASDYAWTAPAITPLQASITPRTLTASLTNTGVTKAYEGTTAAPTGLTPGWSFAGLLGGDAVTVAHTGAAYNSKDVASATTLTVSGLGVATTTGTAQAGDYQLDATNKAVAATITPKVLTASGLTAADRAYDGTAAASVSDWGSVTTGIAGETLGLTGGSASFASKNAGTWTVTATGLQLADGTGLAANYQLANTSAATVATITPRLLHVGYTGVDKVYDGHTAGSVSTTDDRITGDQLGVNWTATFSDKNVGTGKTVSLSGVSLAGSDAGNYTVASTGTTTAAITRLATVTWTGGASGNWFDPANWAGGAVPDLANVAQVVIPGNVTVTFDTTGVVSPAQAGKVQIDSLGTQGSLLQTNGELAVGNGGVTLNGLTQQGGSLTSVGGITLNSFSQSGGSTATQGNLTVNGPCAQGASGSVTVNGNASLSNTTGATTLGNLSVNGGLSIIGTGGDVTQAGGTAVQVQGTTTVDAGMHDVKLDGAANNFVGPVSVTGKDVTLVDGTGGLTLSNITADGKLDVKSTDGDVTQANGSAVQVQGTTTVDAGTHNVKLDGAANNFVGPVNVTGKDVTLVDGVGGLTLGNITAGGKLDVKSTDGDVTQANGSAVQVQGTTTVDAGTHNVKLDGAANDFVGPVNVTGKDVTLVDGAGGLTLGNITASGKLDVKSTGGDVTQAGGSALQVGGTTTVNAGSSNVTLGNAGNDFAGAVSVTGKDVTLADGKGGLTLGDIAASGKLDVTSADGDVTQASGTAVQVGGNTTINAGNANVVLNNAANSFGGSVGVSAKDVTLASTTGGVTLGDMKVSGQLTVNSTAGNVTQAGGSAAQVQGPTTVDAGSHDIVLANGGNDFVGAVNATGKDVTLVDSKGDLTLGNVTTSGNLNATNTSNQIVQPPGATLNVKGDATLNAPQGVRPDPLAGTIGGTLRVNGMASVPPVLVPVIPPPALPTPPTTAVLTIPATLATPQAATTSTGAGASSSRITIEPMQAQQTQTGTTSGAQWVMVTVPQDMATAGFSFALPDWLNKQTPASTTVIASREDGQALPTWLRFEADRRLFVAESVPSGGLPLKVRLTLGDKQLILLITGDAQVAQPGAVN